MNTTHTTAFKQNQ